MLLLAHRSLLTPITVKKGEKNNGVICLMNWRRGVFQRVPCEQGTLGGLSIFSPV